LNSNIVTGWAKVGDGFAVAVGAVVFVGAVVGVGAFVLVGDNVGTSVDVGALISSVAKEAEASLFGTDRLGVALDPHPLTRIVTTSNTTTQKGNLLL